MNNQTFYAQMSALIDASDTLDTLVSNQYGRTASTNVKEAQEKIALMGIDKIVKAYPGVCKYVRSNKNPRLGLDKKITELENLQKMIRKTRDSKEASSVIRMIFVALALLYFSNSNSIYSRLITALIAGNTIAQFFGVIKRFSDAQISIATKALRFLAKNLDKAANLTIIEDACKNAPKDNKAALAVMTKATDRIKKLNDQVNKAKLLKEKAKKLNDPKFTEMAREMDFIDKDMELAGIPKTGPVPANIDDAGLSDLQNALDSLEIRLNKAMRKLNKKK